MRITRILRTIRERGIVRKKTVDAGDCRKNRIPGKVRKAAVILFWLLLWQLLAAAVGNRLLVVGPWETLVRASALLREREFYMAVAMSLVRIGAGFLAGFAAGAALAALSSRFPAVEQLLAPFMSLLKAVPVASFVVILLIWWGSSFLAAAICFLVVLPNSYIHLLEGLKSTDGELREMAQVFRLPFRTRFFYIYRPALEPFVSGSLKLSLGMCWKSGVAAEVIGTPALSIGGKLYLSKIYLDTAGVFAWTAAVILLSTVFEKAVLRLAKWFFAWQPACGAPASAGESPGPLAVSDLGKSFGRESGEKRTVLSGISAVYEPGKIYFLNSPSGSGKTTLLRILAGLAEPDSGEISGRKAVSMMFQEDRLCMDYSAVKNVEMVVGDAQRAAEALKRLLSSDDLEKPCRHLSGGMKRRVALARAMEADAGVVLLDEPFTGMDALTREKAEQYIRDRQQGRTLIIATHINMQKEEGKG